MKKQYILLLVISILSCKEQVSKFIFDASKISNQTKYIYQYDSDKLVSQVEKIYTIMFGEVVDSIITETDFVYNDKGLLVQEIFQTSFENKPSIRIYTYDLNDSLIQEMKIDQDSDTIFWEKYKYFPDGRKIIFHRDLILHFEQNQDFVEAIEQNVFDTNFYQADFVYSGNLCETERQYDINGNLIKTIRFEYQNTKLITEIHQENINSIELIKKVKQYDYSKSDLQPDFYSVDSKNDTIEFSINIYKSDKLVQTNIMYDYGSTFIEEYYNNGLLIGTIDYDKHLMYKILYSYEYNDKGKIILEKFYREKINAH